jgi:hypothetical protein
MLVATVKVLSDERKSTNQWRANFIYFFNVVSCKDGMVENHYSEFLPRCWLNL